MTNEQIEKIHRIELTAKDHTIESLKDKLKIAREALKFYRYHADPAINNVALLALEKIKEMTNDK